MKRHRFLFLSWFYFDFLPLLFSAPTVCDLSTFTEPVRGVHGRHKFLPKNLNDKLVLTTLQGNTATCARAFKTSLNIEEPAGTQPEDNNASSSTTKSRGDRQATRTYVTSPRGARGLARPTQPLSRFRPPYPPAHPNSSPGRWSSFYCLQYSLTADAKNRRPRCSV